PMMLSEAMRREVGNVDRDVPVSMVRTMEQFLTASVAPRRFNLTLMSVFAGAGLLLAVSGIYAVISYSVSHRTREIGIRSALGAQKSQVMGMVLGEGLKLVGIGILVGLTLAFALSQAISSLLFGISSADPLIFVTIPILFTGVALVACCFPALKAARVDPAIALRVE